MEGYDLIVVGGGPGGYEAALEASRKGMKTALIDAGGLGGTCLWRGCIPTKILLHTALLAQEAARGGEIGITAPGLRVDMERLSRYKDATVEKLAGGIETLLKKQKVDLYRGFAQVEGPGRVLVTGQDPLHLRGGNILLAVGSSPARLPVEGMESEGVLDSDGLLKAPRAFDSLIIVGGGVIGMEFACLYAALGCRVTVLEALDGVLANLDRELGQNLKMILKKQGVQVHTSARLQAVEKTGEGLVCRYWEKEKEERAEAQAVLTAVGRRPNTQGLFAPGAAPAMEKGRVLVDQDFRTDRPGLWAIGDVTGGMQLAHMATAQGLNAVARMLGQEPPMRVDVVPSCVYTSPEIASVGLTAEAAKQEGIEVAVKKYTMGGNGKTVLTRQERSFLKVVLAADTGRIVGAQMMCGRATDMIGEFGSAIVNGLCLSQLAGVIRPHPTFNEAVWELARQ